jgi:hypothetical protein
VTSGVGTCRSCDLYAINFGQVLRDRDNANWMDADAPEDVIARMHLRERILQSACDH